MIDFFSANLERKRVKIRVKGTVVETYGAFGPHSHRLITQIGIEIWAVREKNISFPPPKYINGHTSRQYCLCHQNVGKIEGLFNFNFL